MFNIIKKYIFYIIWKFNQIFNYPNYLLEKKLKFNKPTFNQDIVDYPVFQLIKNFVVKNKLFNSGVIVSLSGGVDSMVVLHCLMYLKNFYFEEMNIGCVCVNYNMRFESNDEMKFLQDYLKEDIELKLINDFKIMNVDIKRKDVYGISNGKRTEFENESKNIRYEGYNLLLKNNDKYKGVILGHHKDDLVENVFTNIMYGRNILDLTVMKEISVKNDIVFYRPLLDIHKNEIYKISESCNVPYFKDTTPNWSKRGIMRNEIFPLLEKTFNNYNKKLYEIGKMSDKISFLINKKIIEKYKKKFLLMKFGIVINDYKKFCNNHTLNNIILPKLIHNYGVPYFGENKLNKIYYIDKFETLENINKNFIVYKNFNIIFIILKNKNIEDYYYFLNNYDKTIYNKILKLCTF